MTGKTADGCDLVCRHLGGGQISTGVVQPDILQVLAEGAAVHMYVSLCRNMNMNAGRESAANSYSVKNSMIRYAVILVVFLVICLTDVGAIKMPMAVVHIMETMEVGVIRTQMEVVRFMEVIMSLHITIRIQMTMTMIIPILARIKI